MKTSPMDILIKNLKEEHKSIFLVLEQVTEYGVNSTNGKQLLLSSEDFIIDHLIRENQELYPKYVETCKKQTPLFKESSEEFHKGLLESTLLITEFFKLLSSSTDKDDCREAFQSFTEKLTKRIDWEENKAFKCCEHLMEESLLAPQ
ncbi:MAG: hypothetical protein HQL68_06990 [Magnetococcales bacterium]|nr:hypothetical protein [Magnetococcales bacterium]